MHLHILVPWQANWLAANGCTEEHQSHDCYRAQQSVQRVHEGHGLESATVLGKNDDPGGLGRTLGAFEAIWSVATEINDAHNASSA